MRNPVFNARPYFSNTTDLIKRNQFGGTVGGPLVVVTTAGYKLGFEANMDRVVAFRHKVDNVGAWMKELEGCLFSRAFTPHTVGYDGFTVSVWRNDEDMLCASYRAGLHRTYIDGHKTSSDFDRSSFTRFRILDSIGKWNGRNQTIS